MASISKPVEAQPMEKLSADELAQLPSGLGLRYELIEGELIEMAPTGLEHGYIAADLIVILGSFIRQNKLGKIVSSETGFLIQPNAGTVRAPDLAFIPSDRIPAEGLPKGYGRIVPALVVEVISPSESAAMVQEKTIMWLKFGVSQVWNVYPDLKQIVVYEPSEGGGQSRSYEGDAVISGGEILPNFELVARSIFEA